MSSFFMTFLYEVEASEKNNTKVLIKLVISDKLNAVRYHNIRTGILCKMLVVLRIIIHFWFI